MDFSDGIVDVDVIQAFTCNYKCTYYVDFKKNEVSAISMVGHVADSMGRAFKEKRPYQDYVEMYADLFVVPEYKAFFINEMSQSTIQRKLSSRDFYTFNYVGYRGDKHNYYRTKIAKVRGHVDYVVFGFEDVDIEMRQRNEALLQLEVAVKNAMEADKIKHDFLSNMSHELLTPLNAISGFKEVAALSIDSPEDLEEALSYIGSASRQMTYLVNNILNMSNLINGTVSLNEEVCNIRNLVRDVETVILSEAEEKNIKFTTDLSLAGEENIYADIPLLNRVLMNILGNAVKYTDKHGRVDFTIIQHKTGSVVANYEIHIKDNGIGMSEEFKLHLFEMFSRAHSTTDSGIFGCGLGMAVTKRILDLMNGTIEVESTLGVGTEITINIPLRMA